MKSAKVFSRINFGRIFLFLFSFTLDIRVHAELVQAPTNCVEAKTYCVLKAESKKEVIKVDDVTVSLKKDSTIVRQSENEFSFVKGTALFKAEQKASIETPYGKVSAESGGEILLEKKDNSVSIESIFGKTTVQALGNTKSVSILEGYENYLSEVDQSMKAQVGIPKPILVEPFLKNWAFLTDAPKNEFLESVDRFKAIHEKAVQELSILNDQIVQREIASVSAAQKAEKVRLQREKAEKKARQDMYLDHLLGE